MGRDSHDECRGDAKYAAWRSGLDPARIYHDRGAYRKAKR